MFRRLSTAYVPQPSTTDRLWRVMDLTKFRTLANGGLWLARLDTFGTKYEGALPEPNRLGLLEMLPESGVEWVKQQYDLAALRSSASCWHMNDHDPSERLWREFDKGGDGLAVRTSASRLTTELAKTCHVNGDGPVLVGKVTYIDHAKDSIEDWNVFHATFAVRDKWSYQTELRVLVHTHGTAAAPLRVGTGFFGPLVKAIDHGGAKSGLTEYTGGHADGKAIVFSVDPRALILEIVPNPTTSRRTMCEILCTAARARLVGRVRPRDPIDAAMKAAAWVLQLSLFLDDSPWCDTDAV